MLRSIPSVKPMALTPAFTGNRENAASLMTAAQIADAKQLARDWKPKLQR
jgi:hypothetical protein